MIGARNGVALALLVATPAVAFNIKPFVKWLPDQIPVPRVDNLSTIPDCCLADNTPAGYAALIAQAQAALPETPCGPVFDAPVRDDGFPREVDETTLVHFRDLGVLTLGQTSFAAFGNISRCGNSTFFKLKDTDVEMNSRIEWVENGSPECAFDRYDFVTVLLHEMGHAVGLEHTNVPGSLMLAFIDDCRGGNGDLQELQLDDEVQFNFIHGCEDPATACAPYTTDFAFAQGELTVGEPSYLQAIGVSEGDVVTFGQSSVGVGSGPCFPQLGGLCVDLLPPIRILGTAVGDSTGTALLEIVVPPSLPPGEIATQAIVQDGPGGADSTKSNPLSRPVAP